MRNKGFLKMICLVCLGAGLVVDPCFAGAGESHAKILTNFEIIDKVSSEAARDIIAKIGTLQPGEALFLSKTKSVGAADFMMENAFVKEMRDSGIRIAVESANKEGNVAPLAKYRLSYQIIRLSLTYPRISRRWWFGPREVSRSAQADLFAQFIDVATGDVLWVKESRKQYGDTIDYSRLKQVEDAQYDFTRPPHSEFKMVKLLEPLVVGGIVVGLVYLFFSNQSSK
jgi:hypothetical protein